VKLPERIDPARRERLNTVAEAVLLAKATMVLSLIEPSL
jgi:hypothetical protein